MSQDTSLETIVLEEPGTKVSFLRLKFQKFKEKLRRSPKQLSSEEGSPETLLQGKTVQIYWYLLTHPSGIAGIREIQKKLNLSSPGVVSYHINKLVSAGIVGKNENSEKYYVKEEIKAGFLGFYFRLGYRMIPRFSGYLVVFLFGIILFVIFSITRGDAYIVDPSNWVFFFFLVFGIVITIFESFIIRNMKPD